MGFITLYYNNCSKVLVSFSLVARNLKRQNFSLSENLIPSNITTKCRRSLECWRCYARRMTYHRPGVFLWAYYLHILVWGNFVLWRQGPFRHDSDFVVFLNNWTWNWRVFPFDNGSEKWEKVNFTWHPNGTVSYQPTKTFFFNREQSYGDESDLVQTLNIPLIVSSLFFTLI